MRRGWSRGGGWLGSRSAAPSIIAASANRLIIASDKDGVLFYDLETGQLVAQLDDRPFVERKGDSYRIGAWDCECLADGSLALMSRNSGKVLVVDPENGTARRRALLAGQVYADMTHISPDGRFILKAAGSNGVGHLYDLAGAAATQPAQPASFVLAGWHVSRPMGDGSSVRGIGSSTTPTTWRRRLGRPWWS